jgi:hypothetical protein
VADTYRQTFGVIVTNTQEKRQAWLTEVEKKVDEIFPADS